MDQTNNKKRNPRRSTFILVEFFEQAPFLAKCLGIFFGNAKAICVPGSYL